MSLPVAIVAVLVGLFVLEQAAERFTDAVGALARRLRASKGTVGLLTAGGEWEELAVVVLAIAGGHPAVAVGNVIGASLANLIGSMPLGLLGRRPLCPDRSARMYGVVMLAVTAIAAGMAAGGRVTHVEGGVLVAIFVAYCVSVVVVIRRGWLRPPEDGDDDDELAELSLRRTIVTLVIGLLLIVGAAEAIVRGAVTIAEVAGLSDYAIGATIVAVGTTLPDKAFSLVGGLRGHGGVVTSNATGSNIFVLSLVLGLSALASGSGLALGRTVTHVDLPLLLGASVLVVGLFFRSRLHRRTGVALLALYAGYIALVLARG